jgi:thymidylate kinase
MNMIVEGIDKSGKSTFVRLLQSCFSEHPVILKNSRRPKMDSSIERGVLKERYELLASVVEKNPAHLFIFDRFYPTEMAYSLVKRGYDAMEDKWYWEFDKKMAKLKTSIVYVESPIPIVKQRFKTDKEDYMTPSDVEVVNDRYHKFLEKTKLDVYYVNGTMNNKEVAWSISELMRSRIGW